MSGDTEVELWSEVVRLASDPKAVRLVITFTNGDKYLVENFDNFAIGRYVFTHYLDDGSTVLFQVSSIICADILLED